MVELDEALAATVARRFEAEQVPFLAALVDQPSCSREPEDVEQAARLLDARALALGLSREIHRDPDGRVADHRIYSTAALSPEEGSPPGNAPRREAVALVGHVDTVFPRALGFLGFTRDGDVARGPGVLDMKSGLTSMFGALEAIREAAPEIYARLTVRVVVNSDEEIGSLHSRALMTELAPTLARALVFEAGRAEDAIVTSRKGVGSFELVALGRGGHAGLAHEAGINAIEALAHAIVRVEALTDYARGVTLNVGLVQGGTSANTVPDVARCSIDGRYEHAEDGATTDRRLRDAIASIDLPERLRGARLELTGSFHRPPMVATAASRALLNAYCEQAAAVGLGVGEAPLQGGGSDANLLAAAGVPVIDGLGPRGRGIHQTDEQCSLASLERRTLALARFLVRHGCL